MWTTANSGRRLRKLGFITALGVGLALVSASPARADDAPPSGDEKKAEGGDASADSKGADAKKDSDANGGELREDPTRRYYFLGVRFRDIVVPQFMLEIFAAGGGTANVWLVGPELSMRKGGTEIDISLAYADYGFGPAMFRGKEDEDIAYEIVKSDLKVAYATFDLLYDVPIDTSGMFSFLIGGGIGVGVVAGDLYRNQAYPKSGTPDPSDVSRWQYCAGPDDPNGVIGGQPYCDASNDHYPSGGKKEYSEKSWADGGSKPIVFPWISLPQVSFRVKPIKQLQTRVDLGFSITGFFFGLAAGYGF